MADFETQPEFRIFSGLLKASRSSDGRMRLHGTASSTTKDIHGDTIEASAIDDMVASASKNMTIFLNHSYNVPEDVAGSVESARSTIRGVDHDANPNVDLDFDILVNSANKRAVEAFEAIEHGTKLGISIGAMIPQGGAVRNKDGSLKISHVNLMEASLVGIPANPRSWVEYAVKAYQPKPLDVTAFGDTNRTYLTSRTWDNTTSPNLNITYPVVTNGDFHASGTAPFIVVTEPEIEAAAKNLDIEAACPTCGKEEEDGENCSDSYHKKAVVETDISDATVVIQVDARDGDSPDTPASQDAPTSQPGNGDGLLDETADGDDAALGDTTTRSFTAGELTSMVNLLRQTTSELVEAKKANIELQAAMKAAEQEREQAIAERQTVLTHTKQVLDRLADTPLMRKAPVLEARRSLRQSLGGLYDEDFMNMLEKDTDERR